MLIKVDFKSSRQQPRKKIQAPARKAVGALIGSYTKGVLTANNKFKNLGGSHEERIERIRNSLNRINKLMLELRELSRADNEEKLSVS